MSKWISIACPVLVGVAALSSCQSRGSSLGTVVPTEAITDVALVNVVTGEVVPGTTVIVRGESIAAVGPAGSMKPPAGARITSGYGKFLIPGLWDMHIHLTTESSEALPQYVAHGITGVRDMGGEFEKVNQLRQRVARGELVGPRILSAGPMIENRDAMNGILKDATPDDSLRARKDRLLITSPQAAVAAVDSLARLGVDMIKGRDFADAPTYWAIAGAARRAHLPFVGHAPFGVSVDPVAVADSGQRSLEHWYYPSDLPELSKPEYERIVTHYVRAETALCPTLAAWRQHRFTVDSLGRILDIALRDPRSTRLPASLVRHWKKDISDRRSEHNGRPATAEELVGWNRVLDGFAKEVGRLSRAGMVILAGSDLPFARYPGDALHDELGLLVHEAGLSPAAALMSATLAPARFLGLQNSLGSITAGKIADLVLLDANPLADIENVRRVRAVMTRGRWVAGPTQ